VVQMTCGVSGWLLPRFDAVVPVAWPLCAHDADTRCWRGRGDVGCLTGSCLEPVAVVPVGRQMLRAHAEVRRWCGLGDTGQRIDAELLSNACCCCAVTVMADGAALR
jgi:hypothetical protein